MPNLDATFDKAIAHIGSSKASASNDVKLEVLLAILLFRLC